MTSAAMLVPAFDVLVASEAVDPPRSWWPWLAGFIPGALVVVALVLTLRWLRQRRTDTTTQ